MVASTRRAFVEALRSAWVRRRGGLGAGLGMTRNIGLY